MTDPDSSNKPEPTPEDEGGTTDGMPEPSADGESAADASTPAGSDSGETDALTGDQPVGSDGSAGSDGHEIDSDVDDGSAESTGDGQPAVPPVAPAKASRPEPSGRPSRSANPARAAAATPKTRGPKPQRVGNRWAAPAMLACALIGLVWIVAFYTAGDDIPGMRDLGSWNLIVGMGFIVAAFGFSMKWE